MAAMAMSTSIAPGRALFMLAGALVSLPAFAQANPGQQFPDVIDVKVRTAARDAFDFDVTVSSPYETPSRYADAFRVAAPSGQVLGERILFHDHQNEQPFTRDLYNVRIPASVSVVVVQARDRKHGYGGKSVQVRLPGR